MSNRHIWAFLCCFFWIGLINAYAQPTTEDRLKQLKEWYEQGLIEKEEYDASRREILAGHSKPSSTQPHKYCHYIPAARAQIDFDDTQDDPYLPIASKIIKRILDESGNVAFWNLRANPSVPNATAVILDGKRYIQYNPAFLKRAADGDDWTVIGVFAHEVGHHINFHLDGKGDRKDEELQADEFCGFILKRMGASLAQAQQSVMELVDKQGSDTHPPRDKRLKAIRKGWDKIGTTEPERQPDKNSDQKLIQTLLSEGDAAYESDNLLTAQLRYERVLAIDSEHTYASAQLRRIENRKKYSKLSELEDAKRPPKKPTVPKTNVTLMYRGDAYNCELNLTITFDGQTIVPTSNVVYLQNVQQGTVSYRITGTISCPTLGQCTIDSTGEVEVIAGAELYLYWNNPSYASCQAYFQYY